MILLPTALIVAIVLFSVFKYLLICLPISVMLNQRSWFGMASKIDKVLFLSVAVVPKKRL